MQIVKPNRVSHTYTQTLVAAPSRVFPLMCPVREAEWIDGWDPSLVITESGLAEKDCVFITESHPDDAIWFITQHEPAIHFVEMVKVTPGVTVAKLSIQLQASEGGSVATVTYQHTSLGPAGDEFITALTEGHYVRFMKEWEEQVNHYLAHGAMLPASD